MLFIFPVTGESLLVEEHEEKKTIAAIKVNARKEKLCISMFACKI